MATVPESSAQRLADVTRAQAEAEALLERVLDGSPWAVCVVAGPEALASTLAALEERDLEARFILPNGVDRYTVVARERS